MGVDFVFGRLTDIEPMTDSIGGVQRRTLVLVWSGCWLWVGGEWTLTLDIRSDGLSGTPGRLHR